MSISEPSTQASTVYYSPPQPSTALYSPVQLTTVHHSPVPTGNPHHPGHSVNLTEVTFVSGHPGHRGPVKDSGSIAWSISVLSITDFFNIFIFWHLQNFGYFAAFFSIFQYIPVFLVSFRRSDGMNYTP